jgi:hypothetical protein
VGEGGVVNERERESEIRVSADSRVTWQEEKEVEEEETADAVY